MTSTVRSAAIYARISSDQDGTALGVQRQEEDCRKLAQSLGWPVADVYVDNDLSAYGGKRRPEYERLLEDLKEGARDAVLIYHVDRLTRRPIELEQFLDVLTGAKVRHVRFVAGGDLDIGNGDGLMVLRMLLAVAANESATKSRRVKRKMEQNASAGVPHGGAQRPFGYDTDKITVIEAEALVIRTLAERYVAGESLRALASWLEETGVKTVSGGPWRTPTLRALLASGRIAGLRDHKGQVVGPAVWEAIITEELRAKVLGRMEQAKTSGRRSPRRYLLSGLLRCAKCTHVLYSAARQDTRRYVCSSGPDHGGCGGTMIVAAPVEDLITRGVLHRLDTPELADALANRAAADEQGAVLAEALAEDRVQLEELAGMYAARQVTAAEWMAARNPIEARMKDGQARLSRVTRSDALAGLVGNGEALAQGWPNLTLTRQAAIIRAVLDHAVIGPGTPGAQAMDPNRVQPLWRL
jgi:site-specific DNA recombinase